MALVPSLALSSLSALLSTRLKWMFSLRRLSPADVDGAAELLRSADCIVLQLEIPVATVYHTLRFARAHGIRAILNPAPGQALDLAEVAHADYVIPNETEAEMIGGLPVRTLDDAIGAGLHARCACLELLREHIRLIHRHISPVTFRRVVTSWG